MRLKVIFAAALAAGPLFVLPAIAQTTVDAGIPTPRNENFFTGGPLNFFSDTYIGSQNNNVPVQRRKDTIVQPGIGVEWHFAQSLSATLGGQWNNLDGVERSPAGDYSQHGFTVFGGLSYYFLDNLNANVTGGIIHGHIQETTAFPTGTSSDERGTNGAFISTSVNGNFTIDQFRLAPTLQYLYYSGQESASIDSSNFFRAADPDSLGRISVGGDVYRGFSIGDYYIEPMIHALYEYDTKLLKGYSDTDAFELGGGFNVPVNAIGTTLAFRAYSVVGRDDFSSTLFRVSLYHQVD